LNAHNKHTYAILLVVAIMVTLAALPTLTQGQSEPLLGCQQNNPQRLDCSSLEVTGVCEGTVAVFTIRNTGEPGNGDMRAPTQYRLIVDGVVVETGNVQLAGGATMQISYSGGGTVRLEVDQQIGHPGNSHPQVTLNCTDSTQIPPTETSVPPTETSVPSTETLVPPTETPTEPATGDPEIGWYSFCNSDGGIGFGISNVGGAMTTPLPYTVTDVDGNTVDSGEVLLDAWEVIELTYFGYTFLYLNVGDVIIMADADCTVIEEPTLTPTFTPEPPTEEPTATFTPTEELTTETPTPTEEPTPTPTFTPEPPSATPTPGGSPGCQVNNPERLDCSSIQVTGVCEGDVAVFTIYNSGEPGNGDMRAPTQYRLVVDGVVVQTGIVLLEGQTSMEVRWDGGGTVRLEADQQTGHPGRSRPRATLSCSS
jgi:hypothetical protein